MKKITLKKVNKPLAFTVAMISDLHLWKTSVVSKFIYFEEEQANVDLRTYDLVQKLIAFVDYVIEKNIKYVVVGGDVFDAPNPNEFVRYLFQKYFVAPLATADINIYILIGNHDQKTLDLTNLKSEANIYNLLNNVHVIDKPQEFLFEDKYEVGFVPYGFNLLETNTNTYLTVGHDSVEGGEVGNYEFAEDKAHYSKASLSVFNCLALGHFHKYQDVTSKIFYIGDPQVCNFSERKDTKGFIVLNMYQDKTWDKKQLQFIDRDFVQLDYNIDSDELTSSDEISVNETAICKLNIKGTNLSYRTFNELALKRKILDSYKFFNIITGKRERTDSLTKEGLNSDTKEIIEDIHNTSFLSYIRKVKKNDVKEMEYLEAKISEVGV